MIWKDKELKTYGDISNAVLTILKAPDAENQAEEFMRLYSQETIHAYSNIGYLAGYYDRQTMEEIFKVFKTAHPIFGTSSPTSEEAFNMGKKWGESIKK